MAHLSLYRKYRSQTFEDLVGQDHIVRTLQNALSTDRAAHAYLFTGPRGTGKTSSARLLAKALNCEKGPTTEPCNECDQCRAITTSSHLDVFEMDAASDAGVDDIRERIVEVADYRPAMGRFRIFIIDEVHDLSHKAFDALLKTVEEPPDHLIFILATTEFHKVPTTIRSRCQTLQFHRGSINDLVRRLEHVSKAEGIEAEPAAMLALARMADGAFRDALTLLEQAALTAQGPITVEHVYEQLGLIPDDLVDAVIEAIHTQDYQAIMSRSEQVARLGRDPRMLVESLMHRLSELTRIAYGVDAGVAADGARSAAMHEFAIRIGNETLIALRSALVDCHKELRDVTLPRIWLEGELMKIARNLSAKTVNEPVVRPKAAEPRVVPVAVEKGSNGSAPKKEAVVAHMVADAGSDLWSKVRENLSAMSKTMALRLSSTSGQEVGGQKLVVEFERQMDHDWVTQSMNRLNGVLEQVKQVAGTSLDVEFRVRARVGDQAVSEAVELPSEGRRLEERARDILGAT